MRIPTVESRREHALVQASELIHDQRLSVLLIGLGNVVFHGVVNQRGQVHRRLADDFPDGSPDEITSDKAHRIGFGQVLLDGQVFLGRAFVGPHVEITQ